MRRRLSSKIKSMKDNLSLDADIHNSCVTESSFVKIFANFRKVAGPVGTIAPTDFDILNGSPCCCDFVKVSKISLYPSWLAVDYSAKYFKALRVRHYNHMHIGIATESDCTLQSPIVR